MATTQHVVVHAGQIVVHQRIGVHQLHGAGRAIERLGLALHAFARCPDQQGTHPFATERGRVMHGLVQARHDGMRLGYEAGDQGLRLRLALLHPGAEGLHGCAQVCG